MVSQDLSKNNVSGIDGPSKNGRSGVSSQTSKNGTKLLKNSENASMVKDPNYFSSYQDHLSHNPNVVVDQADFNS